MSKLFNKKLTGSIYLKVTLSYFYRFSSNFCSSVNNHIQLIYIVLRIFIFSLYIPLVPVKSNNNNTIFFASTQYLVYQIVLVKIQLFDDKLFFFAIPYYCVVFIYNKYNNIIYRSHSHPIFLSPFSFFLVVPVV